MPKASSELNIVGQGKIPEQGDRKKRGKSPFRYGDRSLGLRGVATFDAL